MNHGKSNNKSLDSCALNFTLLFLSSSYFFQIKNDQRFHRSRQRYTNFPATFYSNHLPITEFVQARSPERRVRSVKLYQVFLVFANWEHRLRSKPQVGIVNFRSTPYRRISIQGTSPPISHRILAEYAYQTDREHDNVMVKMKNSEL